MTNFIALDSSYVQALANQAQKAVLRFNELKGKNPKLNFIIHEDVSGEQFFGYTPKTPKKTRDSSKKIPELHKAKFKLLEENNFSIFGLPADVEEALYERCDFDLFIQNCSYVKEDNYLPDMIKVTEYLFGQSLENLDRSIIYNSDSYKWFKKRLKYLHQNNKKWDDLDELYDRVKAEAENNEVFKKLMDSEIQKGMLTAMFFYFDNLERYEQRQKDNETDWNNLFEDQKGTSSGQAKPNPEYSPLNYDDIKNRLSNRLFPVIRDNETGHIWLGDIKFQVLEKEKQRNSPIWRYTVVCADSNETAHPTREPIHVIPPEESDYYGNLDKVLADYQALYMSNLKRVFLGFIKQLDSKHKNVNKQKVYLKIQGKDIKLDKSFLPDYKIACFVLPYIERFITCDSGQAEILKFLFPKWSDKIELQKIGP